MQWQKAFIPDLFGAVIPTSFIVPLWIIFKNRFLPFRQPAAAFYYGSIHQDMTQDFITIIPSDSRKWPLPELEIIIPDITLTRTEWQKKPLSFPRSYKLMEHCCLKELVFACRNQAKRSVIRVLMKFPQCVSSANTRGKNRMCNKYCARQHR